MEKLQENHREISELDDELFALDDEASPDLSDAIVDLWMRYFNSHGGEEGFDITLPDNSVDAIAETKRKASSNLEESDRKVRARSDADHTEVPILNPKFASFFSEFSRFLNEGDFEKLTGLVHEVCDPDIKIRFTGPNFTREDEGPDNLVKYFELLLTSEPDVVRKEGKLELCRDKDGIFFTSSFNYTGTRSIKSFASEEFIGTDGLMSMVEKCDFTAEEFAKLLEADKADKEGFRVIIVCEGTRKVYVNLNTNKFCKYQSSYKFTEIKKTDGNAVDLLSSGRRASDTTIMKSKIDTK